jgi:hypothetical protein
MLMVLRILKKISILLFFVFLGVIGMFLLDYTCCPIYHFPEAQSFSGDQWYNPYQRLKHRWFKANFHAHSTGWFALTNGRNTVEEIYNHYSLLGYDIAAVSDYHHINKYKQPGKENYNVYEHGWNIGKTHQVVIGSERIDWLDYSIWQNIHHKRHIIEVLKENADFVILAHPVLNNGYTSEDIVRLRGYDAIEALNHFRYSLQLWDEALSVGSAVWIMGGMIHMISRFPVKPGYDGP